MDHLPESVVLNAEINRVTRLAVNGTELQLQVNLHRWSNADFTAEIEDLMHLGENIIEVDGVLNDFPILDRAPYIYLAGDFGLDAQNRMIAPNHSLSAGGWEQAGYPHFCGIGVYKVRFTAAENFRTAAVKLHTKDVAAVHVNGCFAGQKLWTADEVDITGMVRMGENEIEVRITPTKANMFGAECFPQEPHLSMTRTENGILAPLEIYYGK